MSIYLFKALLAREKGQKCQWPQSLALSAKTCASPLDVAVPAARRKHMRIVWGMGEKHVSTDWMLRPPSPDWLLYHCGHPGVSYVTNSDSLNSYNHTNVLPHSCCGSGAQACVLCSWSHTSEIYGKPRLCSPHLQA